MFEVSSLNCRDGIVSFSTENRSNSCIIIVGISLCVQYQVMEVVKSPTSVKGPF